MSGISDVNDMSAMSDISDMNDKSHMNDMSDMDNINNMAYHATKWYRRIRSNISAMTIVLCFLISSIWTMN